MSGKSPRFSTTSPFRSRISPAACPTKRPATPASSRPPSRHSASPTTSSSPVPCSITSPSTAGVDPSFSAVTTKPKENITVTVRFRPLSPREINSGDELAWYADGDYTKRNDNNPSCCYGFDWAFGPATTTRRVYDVAAQHVVSGTMQGINGTVFAYGVTSSGKTHTMRGEQRSPGIIPLAVKDVFGTIQETPEREFLLRVSYLEIYNEVINDLLDPAGQNLRIREDSQGTYVDGIKEEVVLSPAHALSLIASGEEHRHVGSNNFNLLSSRSHTIFTLTIESSPHGKGEDGEDVTLSQLHLIDLAGSESSKAETSGLRRKEGSYINKSLLTLGTVISKLTDAKAVHIPYRDSKLTRLLQSTLSGHGRVSLICTITPASSNSEETHNTLKFAQRCKRVETKASQNKIVDDKSLIKKYQKEISCLKEELQQLQHGMSASTSTQEDWASLRLELEAGQVKLQSRLEEEEEIKAALMGRIQRLTKLILVSTKNSMQSNIAGKPTQTWRHSFGEDELAYLPDRRRENVVDDDTRSRVSELSGEATDDAHNLDEMGKDLKTNKRRGMLSWLKLKKTDSLGGMSPSADNQSPVSGTSASSSACSRRKANSQRGENPTAITLAGDLFTTTVGAADPTLVFQQTGTTLVDQMDLLQEQTKMLAGEVALHTSSLRRLSDQAACNTEDSKLRYQIQKLEDEISEKKHQIHVLELQMLGSFGMTLVTNPPEMSQALSKLTMQLKEKIFELEIKSADSRILQEQLLMTKSDNAEMQETILLLRQQLSSLTERNSAYPQQIAGKESRTNAYNTKDGELKTHLDTGTPTSVMSPIFSQDDSKEAKNDVVLDSQALEIENLKQEKTRLTEEKDELQIQNKKLAEEASYAKELASAAAVELHNLAEEITRLCYENAKLTEENSRRRICTEFMHLRNMKLTMGRR